MPNLDNEPQIPKNQSPIIDERSGLVSRDWYRFFLNLLNKANQGGGGGSGTVTSVNVSGGTTGLTTSGGPVTTSGTITLAGTLDVDNGGTGATTAAAAITALTGTQTSGHYLRSDGTNAALSAIQVADVPTLNQNTTGQAGSVANALTAGTGISYSAGTTYDGSAAITISNSAPDQTVVLTAGTGISTSGTYPNFTITNTSPSLGGDVVGPSSATDNAVARYDTTTGKLIQNSLVLIGDTGNVTGVNALTAESLTVNDNTTLGFSNTDTLDVRARIISDLEPNANNAKDIGTSGRNWRDGFFGRNLSTVNLEVTGTTSFDGQQGTSGQVLTSAGTGATPTWTTLTTGTVTSVSGTGTVNGISLSGTVTSSGSLTLGGALTGVDLATQVTGTLPIANGGTGITSFGTGVATALGVNTGTSGAFVVNGGALGTPSSGTVTNLTGTASININGTVGATTPNTGAFTTLSATGVTTVQAGTVSAPAITTSGDTNTGIFFPAADTIAFTEGGVEAARIDSSGNLLVNRTTGLGAARFVVEQDTTTANPMAVSNPRSTAATDYAILFYRNGSIVGSVQTSLSATSYVTSSDYRLKEDIQPMIGALAMVSALKPVTYKWKSDGSDGQGFIAHELAEVCPDAVTGEKDAVDSEGNIKPQGIDTSFLVATLTAAIQEQQAMIEELKAKVAALEAK